MAWPSNPLQIVPKEVTSLIVNFIRSSFQSLAREVAVLGLSGGLDSSLAATLTVKSLGSDKVRLYYLPERDSNPVHQKHAQLLADMLNVDLKVISIMPVLRALRIYSLLPLRFFPGHKLKARAVEFGQNKLIDHSKGKLLQARLIGSRNIWIRRANSYIGAKHRVRSVFLYREAERLNGMVIGAANRTEWLTGTFTQFGCDHNADLMPLIHLYRSQLEILAEHLDIPEVIRTKEADPDILPGLNDKGFLLGSFEIADQILWGLESEVPVTEIAAQFGQERASYIKTLFERSAHYREAPYSLL